MPTSAASVGRQSLNERREHTRISCRLTIECRQGSRDHVATVVNMSALGAAFESSAQLDSALDIFLSYRPRGTPVGRQRLKCRIVWSRSGSEFGFVYGVKFLDEQSNIDLSWAHEYMRAQGFHPHRAFRRKARRVECELEGTLCDDQGAPVSAVTIKDLGLGGARLVCRERLEKNLMTTLEIAPCAPHPGGRLLARVIQVRATPPDFQLNVRFLNRPDSSEIQALSLLLVQLLRKRN